MFLNPYANGRTFYLLTSLSQSGGRCCRCGYLISIHPTESPSFPCPLCKESIRLIDLGEEIIRSVLRQEGEVKWVEENKILKENDGVGAFLRFRSSR